MAWSLSPFSTSAHNGMAYKNHQKNKLCRSEVRLHVYISGVCLCSLENYGRKHRSYFQRKRPSFVILEKKGKMKKETLHKSSREWGLLVVERYKRFRVDNYYNPNDLTNYTYYNKYYNRNDLINKFVLIYYKYRDG